MVPLQGWRPLGIKYSNKTFVCVVGGRGLGEGAWGHVAGQVEECDFARSELA